MVQFAMQQDPAKTLEVDNKEASQLFKVDKNFETLFLFFK